MVYGGSMQDINLLMKQLFTVSAVHKNDFIKFGAKYDDYETKKSELLAKWKSFSKEEQSKYNFKKFLNEGLKDIDISEGVKNFRLFNEETKLRKESEHVARFLGVDLLGCNKSLLDILEGYENSTILKRLYKNLKLTVGRDKKSGIDTNEAENIKYCMRQGRELYLSGVSGSYIVKPLNYFYSITAYAYAIILLSSPLRFKLSSIPNSHGIDHKLDYAKISFGGDIKQGTFSELFMSFPVEFFKAGQGNNEYIDICFDRSSSVKAFLENRYDTSLFSLFSMIPEMRDIYSESDQSSLVYPLEIKHTIKGKNHGYEFIIGNGNDIPDIDIMQKSFKDAELVTSEGKKKIFIKSDELSNVSATIYTDIYGKLWYIDNKFYPINIPEICIHFLAISALSNIMRYQPEIWGSILSNDIDARLSTLIRYYLTIYEQKFPFLILRSISDYFPIIRERSI